MATQKYIMQNGVLVPAKGRLFYRNLVNNRVITGNKYDVQTQDGITHSGSPQTAPVTTTGPQAIPPIPKQQPVGTINTKLLIGGGVAIVAVATIIYFATRKK